ncbi:hypothetical protein Hanom_Chr14g01251221 [Helianthus anomalus]
MAELLPIKAPFADKLSATISELLLLASVFQISYVFELLSFTLESSATMAEWVLKTTVHSFIVGKPFLSDYKEVVSL